MSTESLDRAKAREVTADPRKWVQFKCLIAWQISEGILEPGDEVGLGVESDDFGVTRATGLRAFRVLVEEGVLLAPQGGGKPYTVVERKPVSDPPQQSPKWVHPAWSRR